MVALANRTVSSPLESHGFSGDRNQTLTFNGTTGVPVFAGGDPLWMARGLISEITPVLHEKCMKEGHFPTSRTVACKEPGLKQGPYFSR